MLTNDQLREKCPAIFAKRPHHSVSDIYEFAPTIDAVDALREDGWQPVRVRGKKTRDGNDKSKHLIHFRNPDMPPIRGRSSYDKIHPEVILINSHNGACCYQISAGLFRMICSNGLVVSDATFAPVKIIHTTRHAQEIQAAAQKVIETVDPLRQSIKDMVAITMDDKMKLEFAARAVEMKYPARSPFTPATMLQTRRKADEHNDFWTVFNVVQENLFAGGVVGESENGRRVTSHPVRDLNVHLNLNRGLWSLAEDIIKEAA